MKKTFASKVFASKTFASGTWTGVGVTVVVQPNDGWVAKTRQRLLVAQQRERVWIAKDR